MAAKRKGTKKSANKTARKPTPKPKKTAARAAKASPKKKKLTPKPAPKAKAKASAKRRPAPKAKVAAKATAKRKVSAKAKTSKAPRTPPKTTAKLAQRLTKPATKPAAVTLGRFVWYDLMSTDVPRSLDFYEAVFGWSVKTMDMGAMGPYRMFGAGGVDFGGIVPFDQKDGRSHWMPYVSVASIDGACKVTKKNGGVVCVQPFQIPNVGRFAVVADPLGAVSSPMQLDRPPQNDPDAPAPLGAPVWNEMVTPEPDKAGAFYTKLYGWSLGFMDMGPMGTYFLFRDGAKDVAGMMKTPPGVPADARPQWLTYIHVADVDASAAKAEAAGATIGMAPFDVPGVGRMAVFSDPCGATLALFKPSRA